MKLLFILTTSAVLHFIILTGLYLYLAYPIYYSITLIHPYYLKLYLVESNPQDLKPSNPHSILRRDPPRCNLDPSMAYDYIVCLGSVC
jgi:hypothetical protein